MPSFTLTAPPGPLPDSHMEGIQTCSSKLILNTSCQSVPSTVPCSLSVSSLPISACAGFILYYSWRRCLLSLPPHPSIGCTCLHSPLLYPSGQLERQLTQISWATEQYMSHRWPSLLMPELVPVYLAMMRPRITGQLLPTNRHGKCRTS